MRYEAEVEQWGESLAIRISDPVAVAAHLLEGTKVSVRAEERGLQVRHRNSNEVLRGTENKIVSGLNAYTAHADELLELPESEQPR
jgi:antitoxin component of MazEF toxin-antitoxin module